MGLLHRHRWLTPYLLLAPGLAFLALFFVVPLVFLGRQSLETGDAFGFAYRFNWAWHNYKDALRRRGIWQATLRETFKHVNFVALPTMKQRPPRLPLFTVIPILEAQVLALQNTSAVNLAGNPALALPVPIDDPVVPVASLQLIGPWNSEAALLNAGRLVEGLDTPLPTAPQG